MNNENELLCNLDQIHTTELGIMRIKRNLSLDSDSIVEWCKDKINSHSYTIITAHKEK